MQASVASARVIASCITLASSVRRASVAGSGTDHPTTAGTGTPFAGSPVFAAAGSVSHTFVFFQSGAGASQRSIAPAFFSASAQCFRVVMPGKSASTIGIATASRVEASWAPRPSKAIHPTAYPRAA